MESGTVILVKFAVCWAIVKALWTMLTPLMDKQQSSVHIKQGTRRIWEWSCLGCQHRWKDNTTQHGRQYQGGCRVCPEVPSLEARAASISTLGTWFWPALSCWADLTTRLPSLDFHLVIHLQPLGSGEHLSLFRAQWASSKFLNPLLVFSHAAQLPHFYLLFLV